MNYRNVLNKGTSILKKFSIPSAQIDAELLLSLALKKNRERFNVILGMYHDQVLAPIKTVFEFNAINITMGLPFLRVTGEVKFWGVAISSPKTRNAGWVTVPVFVRVLNKTVFSPPSPSRLIKSSILPSWISISCGPFGLIR